MDLGHNMPFSWENQIRKLLEKQMYRCERLVKGGNVDFVTRYPELARELLDDSIKVKVQTKKYVVRIIERNLKYGKIPKPSVIVKRMNRVV